MPTRDGRSRSRSAAERPASTSCGWVTRVRPGTLRAPRLRRAVTQARFSWAWRHQPYLRQPAITAVAAMTVASCPAAGPTGRRSRRRHRAESVGHPADAATRTDSGPVRIVRAVAAGRRRRVMHRRRPVHRPGLPVWIGARGEGFNRFASEAADGAFVGGVPLPLLETVSGWARSVRPIDIAIYIAAVFDPNEVEQVRPRLVFSLLDAPAINRERLGAGPPTCLAAASAFAAGDAGPARALITDELLDQSCSAVHPPRSAARLAAISRRIRADSIGLSLLSPIWSAAWTTPQRHSGSCTRSSTRRFAHEHRRHHPPAEPRAWRMSATLRAAAEEAGADWVGIPDAFWWRDTWVLAWEAVRATRRIAVGPLVTNPYTRHPFQTISRWQRSQELAPGRGVPGHRRRWCRGDRGGRHPADRMRAPASSRWWNGCGRGGRRTARRAERPTTRRAPGGGAGARRGPCGRGSWRRPGGSRIGRCCGPCRGASCAGAWDGIEAGVGAAGAGARRPSASGHRSSHTTKRPWHTSRPTAAYSVLNSRPAATVHGDSRARNRGHPCRARGGGAAAAAGLVPSDAFDDLVIRTPRRRRSERRAADIGATGLALPAFDVRTVASRGVGSGRTRRGARAGDAIPATTHGGRRMTTVLGATRGSPPSSPRTRRASWPRRTSGRSMPGPGDLADTAGSLYPRPRRSATASVRGRGVGPIVHPCLGTPGRGAHGIGPERLPVLHRRAYRTAGGGWSRRAGCRHPRTCRRRVPPGIRPWMPAAVHATPDSRPCAVSEADVVPSGRPAGTTWTSWTSTTSRRITAISTGSRSGLGLQGVG